jgi:hypothetical protein
MPLKVRLRALASGTDGHGKIFVRVPRRGEFIQVGSGLVLPDDKEADSVRAPAVFLRIDLGL